MIAGQRGQEFDLFQLLNAEVLLWSNILQMFGMGYTTEHKAQYWLNYTSKPD